MSAKQVIGGVPDLPRAELCGQLLVRVSAGHFVAGIIIDVETQRCVKAAPILKWTIGHSAQWLAKQFERDGSTTEVCN